jgi:uncharacterized protein
MSSLIRRHPLTAFLIWFFTVGQAIAFTPLPPAATAVPPETP